MNAVVSIGSITIGEGHPPVLVAGLCVIESLEHTLKTALALREMCQCAQFPLVFKASFDKANRSTSDSYRGPGLETGLDVLSRVKQESGLCIMTDIHEPAQAVAAASVVDVIQIPAFLCRQTDLLTAAARTGKPINLKKGQFMAPWDMKNALGKITQEGNRNILLTERGACFGYNNLVADLRALSFLRQLGAPVIMDVTHSLQLPGGLGHATGGYREFIPNLARAAMAWGCDGLFLEVHEAPERALSDGPNSLPLEQLPALLRQLKSIYESLALSRMADPSDAGQ